MDENSPCNTVYTVNVTTSAPDSHMVTGHENSELTAWLSVGDRTAMMNALLPYQKQAL